MKIKKKIKKKVPEKEHKKIDFVQYIQRGIPKEEGYYFCYTEESNHLGLSSHNPLSGTKVIKYDSKIGWGTNFNVLAWIGPFPVFPLKDLQSEKPKYKQIAYAIGNEKDGLDFKFKEGPFFESIKPVCHIGDEGDCIFQIDPEKEKPEILYYWNPYKNLWSPVDCPEGNEICFIASVKEMKSNKYKINSNSGNLLKKSGKKGQYIFELKKGVFEPKYQWKDKWIKLSKNKINKLKKLLN